MSRISAYYRIPTLGQMTENQCREIESANLNVGPQRIIEEQASGSVAINECPDSDRLPDHLESGDVLIVTRLNRLGRNTMDIRKTVEQPTEFDIRVHCLALGGVDLTSSTGKMTMQVISAIAEFERDPLLERTYSGIARARDAGRRFGRPPPLNEERKQKVFERVESGAGISAIAREFRTTRQTILKVRVKRQTVTVQKVILAWDISRFPSGPRGRLHHIHAETECENGIA